MFVFWNMNISNPICKKSCGDKNLIPSAFMEKPKVCIFVDPNLQYPLLITPLLFRFNHHLNHYLSCVHGIAKGEVHKQIRIHLLCFIQLRPQIPSHWQDFFLDLQSPSVRHDFRQKRFAGSGSWRSWHASFWAENNKILAVGKILIYRELHGISLISKLDLYTQILSNEHKHIRYWQMVVLVPKTCIILEIIQGREN